MGNDYLDGVNYLSRLFRKNFPDENSPKSESCTIK